MAEKFRRRRRKRSHRSRSLKYLPQFVRHSARARLVLLVGTSVVAFAIGMFFFGYLADVYKGWRQNRLLQRASILLNDANSKDVAAATQQHDLEEAMRIAKQVLRLHPSSLPAYYVLAEAAEKRNLEETVVWRAQIARLLPHDLDSQLNLASAALRFGQLDLARRALNDVPLEERGRAAFHVVAGWLARAEGNFGEQERQFAAAVKRDPGNDLYQFNLAALRIRSPDPERSADARATLERLSKNTSFRTGALRALLNDAVDRSDFAAADAVAQQLQMSQQVTFNDYLLCLNFYRKLDEKKFDALLQKVKPFAARNSVDLALLIDWMNNNGLPGEVLQWLDDLPSAITTQPPVAISVADAFANMKNWSRLKRWTRAGSWKDAEYLRLAYQALGARESRQSVAEAEFTSLWRSAERQIDEQPDRQLKLARLATKWNLAPEADALWSRVSKNPPTRREALDALYRIYRENNELRKLYDVLQRLHETSPNEPGITANLARLGMNLDQNTPEAHRLAKEAYDRAPDDLSCAITYAFSLYGMGRSGEGIDVLKKSSPEQLHDPHAAVYVAALLLDENQPEAAGEYIDAAGRGRLYLEERTLLEEAKSKRAAALAGSNPAPNASPTPVARSTPVAPNSAPTTRSTPTPAASPSKP
jgi:predicted Zn-dependent protease